MNEPASSFQFPPGWTFRCSACIGRFPPIHANLDAAGKLICGECWVANPPQEDVDRIFAEVMAHMSKEAEL